jgi:cytochrome c peroxidase
MNIRQTAALAGVLIATALTPASITGQSALAPIPLLATAPADNPTTPQRVALGRALFWDPILSGRKDVACATCHHPDFGYSDGLPLSIGVNGAGVGSRRTFTAGAPIRFAKRNSQTVLNAGLIGLVAPGTVLPVPAPMFWDSRKSGLEAQALEPVKSAEEMRGDAYSEADAIGVIVARVRAVPEYVRLFRAAFAGGPDVVNADNMARAIAAFERSLVAVNSPYDRYIAGDHAAMTPLQVAGMQAFERVGCSQCHSGPLFSDFKLHVLGVPANRSASIVDDGANGTHAFRTPTLRNLRATGPYMHTGVFASLEDVVRFYNRGGGRGGRGGRGGGGGNPVVANVQRDPLFRQLRGVGRSREELTAFLMALNDESFDRTIPKTVPSGLTPGGRID